MTKFEKLLINWSDTEKKNKKLNKYLLKNKNGKKRIIKN